MLDSYPFVVEFAVNKFSLLVMFAMFAVAVISGPGTQPRAEAQTTQTTKKYDPLLDPNQPPPPPLPSCDGSQPKSGKCTANIGNLTESETCQNEPTPATASGTCGSIIAFDQAAFFCTSGGSAVADCPGDAGKKRYVNLCRDSSNTATCYITRTCSPQTYTRPNGTPGYGCGVTGSYTNRRIVKVDGPCDSAACHDAVPAAPGPPKQDDQNPAQD